MDNSAFHPDNINNAMLIMLARIYDTNMALLAVFDQEQAIKLDAMHSVGMFLASPPSFAEQPSDTVDQDQPVAE